MRTEHELRARFPDDIFDSDLAGNGMDLDNDEPASEFDCLLCGTDVSDGRFKWS
jgi:hypothetical protein